MKHTILTALLAFTATCVAAEQPNLIINPGFEQAAGRMLNGWRIGDKISSVTTGQAHAGKRAPKIVDPDKKTGSSGHSSAVAVEPGKQ